MKKEISVFFAGELFDHKDITGNLILAEYIEKNSCGHFKCILPQDIDSVGLMPDEIRKADLRLLFDADIALFNFDGSDLDSGTVVEFTCSKAMNKPALLLRTDFRSAGDQAGHGDPWNLMCSGYKNTETLIINSIVLYKENRVSDTRETLEKIYSKLAFQIIEKLNKLELSLSAGDSVLIAELKESMGL